MVDVKNRTARGATWALCIVAGVALVVAVRTLSLHRAEVGRERERAKDAIQEAAAPLIDAIESFNDLHGRYPDDLGQLSIPIPETEFGAFGYFPVKRGGFVVYVGEYDGLLGWEYGYDSISGWYWDQ